MMVPWGHGGGRGRSGGERCRWDLAPPRINNNNSRISSKVPALPSSPLSQRGCLQWLNWEPAVVKLGGQGGLWGTGLGDASSLWKHGQSLWEPGEIPRADREGSAWWPSDGALAFQFCHGGPAVS